jgi:arabinofuranan 3-O-arabinosyltransferase
VSRDLSPVRPAPPAPVAARPVWRRRDLAEPAAYGVLGLCVLAVLVLTDRGWFAPDTRPELYLAPWRALTRSLAAWRPDPYLGQPNFDAGTAPAAAVLAVIRGLGVDAWLAVRLWRALLLGVAGWGAARLLRTVAPEAGAAGRGASAHGWVAHP